MPPPLSLGFDLIAPDNINGDDMKAPSDNMKAHSDDVKARLQFTNNMVERQPESGAEKRKKQNCGMMLLHLLNVCLNVFLLKTLEH